MNENVNVSWVDILTNTAYVHSEPQVFSNVFIGQKFPPPIFFTLLHESTHHWFGDSILGNLLFLTRMKTAIEAQQYIQTTHPSNDQTWDIFSNNLRYEFLNKVLHPLHEGLALFCELDSFPSSTEAVPPHLIFATMVFSGLSRKEISERGIAETERMYKRFLFLWKINERHGIERKKDILLSPFHLGYPYLLGYLFLKNIQLGLTYKNEKFSDANLFIYFMKSWFFNDVGWAEVLYRKDVVDENIASSILEYFYKRVSDLNDIPGDLIDELEKNLLIENNEENCINLLTEKWRVDEGNRILDDLFYSMVNIEHPALLSQFEKRKYFRTLKIPIYYDVNERRAMVRVRISDQEDAELKYQAEIESKFLSKIDGVWYRLLASLPLPEAVASFSGIAQFEQYVCFNQGFANASFITAAGTLLYHIFSPGFPEEGKELLLGHYENFYDPTDSATVNVINEIMALIFEVNTSLPLVQQAIEETMYPQIEQFYTNTALLWCNESTIENLSIKLREDGFWLLVDGDISMVKRIALISQMNALSCIDKNIVLRAAGSTGIGLDDVILSELKACLARQGLDIILTDEDHVYVRGA
jgi:hypothetical protein